MQLILYNTRTKTKELFRPMEPTVRIYSCGPTVYSRAHIGNLRTYIFVDTLRRTLQYLGFPVRHVMNITDVGHLTSDADEGEDKLAVAAARERRSAWEIARDYTERFFRDTDALQILRPQEILKATEHISEQIALIQNLERAGFTYRTADGLYFDTKKFPRYNDFAKRTLAGLREGARVERHPEKRNPTDFALWKFSPPGVRRDMEWESPWGKGFPGWHIECSAMAIKALGEQIDIHTGGIDHIPIHHPNEIAQSEAATGKSPFANFWLHGAFLTAGDDRMGKSEGNVLTLDAVQERGIPPLAFRFFVLEAHYRQPLQFRWEALAAAEEGLERLRQFLRRLHLLGSEDARADVKERIDLLRKTFLGAITDDLNTPAALGAIFSFSKEMHALIDQGEKRIPAKTIITTLLNFDDILGLNLRQALAQGIPKEIQELAQKRETARKNGDYKTSDLLRAEIASKGFLVEDTPKGPLVRPR